MSELTGLAYYSEGGTGHAGLGRPTRLFLFVCSRLGDVPFGSMFCIVEMRITCLVHSPSPACGFVQSHSNVSFYGVVIAIAPKS